MFVDAHDVLNALGVTQSDRLGGELSPRQDPDEFPESVDFADLDLPADFFRRQRVDDVFAGLAEIVVEDDAMNLRAPGTTFDGDRFQEVDFVGRGRCISILITEQHDQACRRAGERDLVRRGGWHFLLPSAGTR